MVHGNHNIKVKVPSEVKTVKIKQCAAWQAEQISTEVNCLTQPKIGGNIMVGGNKTYKPAHFSSSIFLMTCASLHLSKIVTFKCPHATSVCMHKILSATNSIEMLVLDGHIWGSSLVR